MAISFGDSGTCPFNNQECMKEKCHLWAKKMMMGKEDYDCAFRYLLEEMERMREIQEKPSP